MPQKKIKLGIFDIDGTIFRSSLLIELVHGLVAKKIFPKEAELEIKGDYEAWLDRRGDYHAYLMRVVNVYMRYHRGVRPSDIQRAVRHVLDTHKDRVYRYTRDLLHKLKSEDYVLIAISGSPDYMVRGFAQYLGFQVAFGPLSEVKRGRYTGRRWDGKKYTFDGRSLPPKDVILKQYIKESGLKVDLAASIAVGDTEGDVPLLKLVGHPLAFNPNSVLATAAKKRGWQIIVERKDVVYDATRSRLVRLGQ